MSESAVWSSGEPVWDTSTSRTASTGDRVLSGPEYNPVDDREPDENDLDEAEADAPDEDDLDAGDEDQDDLDDDWEDEDWEDDLE